MRNIVTEEILIRCPNCTKEIEITIVKSVYYEWVNPKIKPEKPELDGSSSQDGPL